MFQYHSFTKTGAIAGLIGAYFGVIIDSLYLKGTRSDINDTGPK